MFRSKIDLFNLQWLDVVFYGRNKSYGAYDLRKNSSRTTGLALLIGGGLFVFFVSLPLIIRLFSSPTPPLEKFKEVEVILSPPPPINKEIIPSVPPPPAMASKPKVEQVKFPPPVVVPAAKVRNEEPPTVDELKKANPGQKNIQADPNAEIKIDEPAGESNAKVTEDNSLYTDYASLEVMPAFPGGMGALAKYLGKTIRYPALARENNISGRVFISFVVEKDGRLTDIKIVRGIGAGCDEEAVRVLKLAPAWKPGIQNGRPVRVTYTIPVFFQLSTQ